MPVAGRKLFGFRDFDNTVLFAFPHLLLAAPGAERGVVGDFALTGLAFRHFNIFVLPYCCRLLSLRLVMVLAGIELIWKGRPIGRLFLFSTKINKKLVKSVH